MGIFNKQPEARSWSGHTASELASGSSSSGEACDHKGSSIVRRQENVGRRKVRVDYSCQRCGTDYSIVKNV